MTNIAFLAGIGGGAAALLLLAVIIIVIVILVACIVVKRYVCDIIDHNYVHYLLFWQE